jgi:metallo-beta-lactamase family protein
MRIRFIGAAGGSVTGSCTHFHYPRTDTSFLADCGLVQGEGDFESINGAAFPFDASTIEFVLLTHAHVDHCGLLPKLYQAGFSGEVICTAATAKLAKLSLTDSARYPNSLFSADEVERIRFKPIEEQPATAKPAMFPVRKDLFAGFRRTAHIIGACSVTIGWLDEQDRKRYVVMSGDLGNNVKDNLYQPLLAHRRGVFAYPDAIIVESTYGGRTRSQQHKSFDARIETLRDLLQREVFDRKALLVVPAFALQRTHEILLDLVVVLQRHFATTATSTSPYLAPSRLWKDFDGDRWTGIAHEAFQRAVLDLPADQQQAWTDAFEPTGERPYVYRLKPGHAKSIDELRTLVETQRAPYPIDVILDSGLARSMGAIIREELLRRSAHKPDEPAHRNPDMSARLGCASEDRLKSLLEQLMPNSEGDVPPMRVGPHTILFQTKADVPSRAQCETRGAILLTGGGMCDGGPVVAHLEKLALPQLL